MAPSNRSKDFIDTLKSLIAFLQTIWGLLAGISLFFPLSNDFVRVIPLEKIDGGEIYGGLAYISPDMVTVVSTVIVFFVMFQVISRRNDMGASKRRTIQHEAISDAVIALVAFVVYLFLYVPVAQYLNEHLIEYYFLRVSLRLLCDISMLLAYSILFARTTKAFMLLGMIEFMAL